jgi:methionine sulfoxide reductase heme-binding subunit
MSFLAATGPSVSWYLTRSSGVVSLLLLTGATVLGVLDVRRTSSTRWPRFVIDALHRNVALLAIAFLFVHIFTSVIDDFTSIGLIEAFVPFVSSYRPFWLGLGALACDMLLAVAITSMLRQRIGYATWRVVHWLSYACWPIALLHGLGTGSDTKAGWMLLLDGLCLGAVMIATVARAVMIWGSHPERGRLAVGGAGLFTLFLALWMPSGPLGHEWARRSGTPATLLPHHPVESGGDR